MRRVGLCYSKRFLEILERSYASAAFALFGQIMKRFYLLVIIRIRCFRLLCSYYQWRTPGWGSIKFCPPPPKFLHFTKKIIFIIHIKLIFNLTFVITNYIKNNVNHFTRDKPLTEPNSCVRYCWLIIILIICPSCAHQPILHWSSRFAFGLASTSLSERKTTHKGIIIRGGGGWRFFYFVHSLPRANGNTNCYALIKIKTALCIPLPKRGQAVRRTRTIIIITIIIIVLHNIRRAFKSHYSNDEKFRTVGFYFWWRRKS